LIINSDNVIELPELTNGIDGTHVTGATVELTLLDQKTGVEIGNETWPLTMAYASGTKSTYRATAKYDLPLTHKEVVLAKVVADAGFGLRREWQTPCKCVIGI
jgi:hypothetical protein